MLKKIIKVILPTLLSITLFSPGALADAESWNWAELRLPLIRENDLNFPKTNLRIFSDTRINTRSRGLSESFIRVGPLVNLTPWLFVGLHGTLVANRLPDGAFQQEGRLEIEPNFYGRLGDFTFNDRNRLEYRSREVWTKWRYRNQLRINYAPPDAKLIPYIWDEVLIDLSGEGFNQNRFSAGAGYQFNKYIRLDAGYLLRHRLVNSSWIDDHMLLLSLFADFSSI